MDGSKLFTSIAVLLFVTISAIPIHTAYAHEIVCITEPCEHTHDNRFGTIKQSEITEDPVVTRFSADLTIVQRVQNVFADIQQALTFDPLAKAKLKLADIERQQSIITQNEANGLPIPIEAEERRIEKLNEVNELVGEIKTRQIGTEDEFRTAVCDETIIQATGHCIHPNDVNKDTLEIAKEIDLLNNVGELNDIRILYSQADAVGEADQATKDAYNAKVNSLETWNEFCLGEFDIDDYHPINDNIEKLEMACPELADLRTEENVAMLMRLK